MKRLIYIDVEDCGEDFIASPIFGTDGDKRRASHVEPACPIRRSAFHLLRWLCGESGAVATLTRQTWLFGAWRVNLAPVGGPVLPTTYTDRAEAITHEVAWLHSHPEHWVH